MNVLLALDRLGAALTGRSGLYTMSQEVEADRLAGYRYATLACQLLADVFGRRHCQESTLGDSSSVSLWGATAP